ncbi:hypothetical protein FJ960_08980 [Mesorhizobium sp. B2-3-11]|uniref:hypothetical protein n=1 Tax=Mesorhizobium sp. B2-3-11 TaxID=2589953 RepID=UPI001126192D|nr:hypothetical protein [Mesorhizobium sp. B2-3-11]TPM07044.1 hypothetical protein FJ960_08980 [Mesorhizobium sp. B2-3-11]
MRLVEIDTAHFKYNASAEVALSGAGETLPGDDGWAPLLSRRPLQPDTRHVFRMAETSEPVSYVRVDAYPDGGISRVRLWGNVDPTARRAAGYRWFNAMPPAQATHVVMEQGMSSELAAHLTASRPHTVQSIGRFAGSATSDADALASLNALLDGDIT